MKAPRHILLVDDDDMDQYIGRHVISRKWPACKLSIAHNGEDAIEVLSTLQEDPPDLILLDVNMPRMNGHEFLAAWYADKGIAVPVVIMLSSSEQSADRDNASRYSCVRDYLVKPLSDTALEAMTW